MSLTSKDIRGKFLTFFQTKGHSIVPSSSLLPDDPSVLLTTAGMQQFKPYFTGEGDPVKDFGAKNTVSIQKCFRTSDIEEVGDERHLTFFEMLGNFSFGGYWKPEAIQYAHEFITKELGLEISYVTIFRGSDVVPKDTESKEIWNSLGITDVREEGIDDVFWGPTGNSGPCGPTTEIYCKNAEGKDIEIWNIVFNEFMCDGSRENLLAGKANLTPLDIKGIDTGMGFERLVMTIQKVSTVFETDLFSPIMGLLSGYLSEKIQRIVADHTRSVCFLITDGVRPANKGAGYILRRLMRRVIFYGGDKIFASVLEKIIEVYQPVYSELKREIILEVFNAEAEKFQKTLSQGLRELGKVKTIDAVSAFKLFESYGLPFDIIHDKFPELKKEEFEAEFKKHQDVSRSGMEKKFAGGLADHEPATIKLHTAHHLLLAALQQVLGPQVKQRGSNITSERLRLDFIYPEKLTDEQKKKVEEIVNSNIKAALPVEHKEMPKSEAEKLGAEMEFGQKYGEQVSVYLIGQEGNYVSREFCGGPHVVNTSELGRFKITKEEAVAAGVRRIRAELTS
jgi:alanyl-tRNA synthetase